MTDYATIVVEQRDRVGLITLNRPDALNALSAELGAELVTAATAFDRDDTVGAIVITGSPKAFAAGADIKEMAEYTFADAHLANVFEVWDGLTRVRTPIIAAVAGYALGGGCELAMMCDMIIAAENAKFGQPEINLAIIPGMGGTQRLTRAVGKAKAMDLVLTGRMMDAAEAESCGLVARVVGADELVDSALQVAAEIASKSLPVVYLAKEAVNAAFESSLAEGLRFERRSIHAAFSLDDQTEGMGAFVAKRSPNFTHR